MKRNNIVVSFIKGVIGKDVTDGTMVSVCKTVEHLYHARNQKFISPISFCQNLLTYYVTGSKFAAQINSRGSPSGSYATIKKWIADHAVQPLTCPDDTDVVTFFDNNQVTYQLILKNIFFYIFKF